MRFECTKSNVMMAGVKAVLTSMTRAVRTRCSVDIAVCVADHHNALIVTGSLLIHEISIGKDLQKACIAFNVGEGK